ncbi:MAG: oligosaccharide flippase family protein, partial [Hyphomonas sp.]|nr:oligosaccharide flippase family protein [Hyphomonas sp.]
MITKIVENISWLLLDKVFRMGVGLIVGVWVARYLGPSQYGLLSFAVAFVSLFAPLAGLGMQSIVVRDIVRTPTHKHEILGTAALMQFLSSVLAYMLILASIAVMRPDDMLAKALVAIIGSMILFRAVEVSAWWFESQVLSKYTVWVRMGSLVLFSGLKVGLILLQAPLIAFAWTIMSEALAAA